MKSTIKLRDRIIAMIVSFLLVIGIMAPERPSVHASTPSYTNDFTFTVTDELGPVAGATVSMTNTGKGFSISHTTDANGVASFPEFTAKGSTLVSLSCTCKIEKAGYPDQNVTIDSSIDGWRGNKDILLERAQVITGVSVVGYTGEYDGNNHNAVSISKAKLIGETGNTEALGNDYTVSYSSDGNTYSSSTIPQIKDVGTSNVYVKIERSGYQPLIIMRTAEVRKIDRTDFGFATAFPADLVYSQNLTYTNAASSAQESSTITYESNDTTVGTVNAEGKVTFLKAGTVTITATMATSDNYNTSKKSYTITAKSGGDKIAFAVSTPSAITYGDNNNKFTNLATCSVQDTKISYYIKEFVTGGTIGYVNYSTGEVTFTSSGIMIVEARASNKFTDKLVASTTYTLTVNKANQSGFGFADPNPRDLAYGISLTNLASGGQGNGNITYTIISGADCVEINNGGSIQAKKVGTCIIEATKDADSQYNKVSARYTINTVKADRQAVYFNNSEYNATSGQKKLTVSAYGGAANGESTVSMAYSIISGSSLGTIGENGEITFNTGKAGKIVVKALMASDEHFNEAKAFCVVNISSGGFGQCYAIEGTLGDNNWYKSDVTIKPYENFAIADSAGSDQWKDKEMFTEEKDYGKITRSIKSTAGADYGKINELDIINQLRIDKTAPSDLDISYSASFKDCLMNFLSFGFYNGNSLVTFKAKDMGSGIDRFVCKKGNETFTITKNEMSIEDNVASASFEITPQFKGDISFIAYDKAGNSHECIGSKTLVVDNVAPVISVEYDNNNVINDSYYNADRIATIRITENNFDAEDVVIQLQKRLNDESEYNDCVVEPEFEENGNIHIARINFDENADYKFTISYTDKSGNEAEDYIQDEFTIDKIAPVLNVTYADGNDKDVYAAERTAHIEITEHNFDKNDVTIALTAKNAKGDIIEVKDYQDVLSNCTWNDVNDVHSTDITFTEDANYDIRISYTDLAGYNDEFSDTFSIDKTVPSSLTIGYSQSVADMILEARSFGFYKAPVTVTLEATDETTGVDHFTYSYAVMQGASAVNKGTTEDIIIPTDKITYSENRRIATATFVIEPQYKGNVSYVATDKANNSIKKEDDKTIVVDNMAPIITVSYDNNNAYNTNYYNAKRKATIQINEANFDKNDVIIKVGKRLNNATSYLEEAVTPSFTDNGDLHTAYLNFDENADYYMEIKYTDKSGNPSSFRDEFTVDLIKPVINVAYNNNDSSNSTYFKDNRVATIAITEHNLTIEDINVKVTATDASGKAVLTQDYISFLKDVSNWKINGDHWTTSITYSVEANYTFDISCKDKANNSNAKVDYAQSVAPTRFTVDKTNPFGSVQIGNWDKSVSGARWNQFLSNVSFALCSKDSLKVSGAAGDTLSGIDVFEYFKSSEVLTMNQMKTITNWETVKKGTNKFSYQQKDDSRFIIYVHIVDKAGNAIYVSSDGVIVDKHNPEVKKVSPEVTVTPKSQPVNGIYNTDVDVDVKVIDPIVNNGVYSGLRSVKYEVLNQGEITQSGTLLNFTKSTPSKKDLVHTYDKANSITVSKEKNNSNEVEIKVTAIDNAGNMAAKIASIKIDTTDPIVDIEYSNNTATNENYFKEARVASITVTERNFDPDDVNLIMTAQGAKVPGVGKWTKTAGSENGDNTKWNAKITYSNDGDYTFDLTYADLAGNKMDEVRYARGTVAPTEFTVDKTNPVINVTYNNDEAKNGNYYKDNRTATIAITEHNFNVDKVVIKQTATDNGKKVALPKVSQWSTKGDRHTATIVYEKDALYTFGISYADQADNKAEEFKEHKFYIDKTAPQLEISGVVNNSANNGDIAPIISYSDTNYTEAGVTLTLTGASNNSMKLDGSYENDSKGGKFTFNNFPKEKNTDDIYTLKGKVVDKAGNVTEKVVVFSVNRFGSTYAIDEGTKKLNGSFVRSAGSVILSEVNANELRDIKITLFKNDKTLLLKEGEDYSIQIEGGNGSWYHYTYTVFDKNFADDGIYRISVQSTDVAGNVSENTLDTKISEIGFGVDKTEPNVIVTNLESGVTYPLEQKSVVLNANDNLKLDSVIVYLDGEVFKSWSYQDIQKLGDTQSELSFDISGDSTKAHEIKIVSKDAAGNESTINIANFYVTTNLWVRYWNNKGLLYGSIGGVVLLIGALFIFLLVRNKRRDEFE